MAREIKEALALAGVSRQPIKLPSGEMTTEYQVWKLVFGYSEKKKQRRRRNEIVALPPITRDELVKDRFGVVLHQKLTEVAPNRLFAADYYVLQYHLPDAPFLINVTIDDASAVLRAYDNFEKVPAKAFDRLAGQDRFRLVPRKTSDPVFDMAPKNLVDGQLVGTATMVNWLAAQYVNSRLDIKTFDKIMGMRPIDMKREVYAYIPRDEQPDHEYLLAPKKVKRIAPEVQYKSGMISLQEYADIKNPERKNEREKASLEYPLPERTYICCICHEDKAQIKCMECPNRVCKECMQTTFLDYPEEQTFLLLHHMYCLRFGRPSRAFFGTKLRNSARAMAMVKGRKTLTNFGNPDLEAEQGRPKTPESDEKKHKHKHRHGHKHHGHHRHKTEVVSGNPKQHDIDHRVLVGQKSPPSIASGSFNQEGSTKSLGKQRSSKTLKSSESTPGSQGSFPAIAATSSGSSLFSSFHSGRSEASAPANKGKIVSFASGKNKEELMGEADRQDEVGEMKEAKDMPPSKTKSSRRGILSMLSSKKMTKGNTTKNLMQSSPF